MKKFEDRLPNEDKVNWKKISHLDENGEVTSEEYAIVENADEPTVEGTPINRANMYKAQGFDGGGKSYILSGGNIIEINSDSEALKTYFNNNKIIQEFDSITGQFPNNSNKNTTLFDYTNYLVCNYLTHMFSNGQYSTNTLFSETYTSTTERNTFAFEFTPKLEGSVRLGMTVDYTYYSGGSGRLDATLYEDNVAIVSKSQTASSSTPISIDFIQTVKAFHTYKIVGTKSYTQGYIGNDFRAWGYADISIKTTIYGTVEEV